MARSTPYKNFSKLLAHTTVVLEAVRRFAFRNLAQYKCITHNRPMTHEDACRELLRRQGNLQPDHVDQRMTEHAVMAPIKIYGAVLYSAYEFMKYFRNDPIYKDLTLMDDNIKCDPLWDGIKTFRGYYVHPEAGHSHTDGKAVEDLGGTEKLVQFQDWILKNLQMMQKKLFSTNSEIVRGKSDEHFQILSAANKMVCDRMRSFNDFDAYLNNKAMQDVLLGMRPSRLANRPLSYSQDEIVSMIVSSMPSSLEFDNTHSCTMPPITGNLLLHPPSPPKYPEIRNHYQHLIDTFIWLHEICHAIAEIRDIMKLEMEGAQQQILDNRIVPYFGYFRSVMKENWSAAVASISMAMLQPHVELYQRLSEAIPKLKCAKLDSLLEGNTCTILNLRHSVFHVAELGNDVLLPEYYHGEVNSSSVVQNFFTFSDIGNDKSRPTMFLLYDALRDFYEIVNSQQIPIKKNFAKRRNAGKHRDKQRTSGKKS